VADKLLAGSAYVVLTWSSVVTCALPVWLTVTMLFRDGMLVVGVVVVNLTVGPREFSPSRLGKLSTALTLATGALALAANATGDCPGALRWLYLATLAVLIASTAHYVYQASERPARRPGSEPSFERSRRACGEAFLEETFGSHPRSVRARRCRADGPSVVDGQGPLDDAGGRAGQGHDPLGEGAHRELVGFPTFTGSEVDDIIRRKMPSTRSDT